MNAACGISGAIYLAILCVTGCSCLYSCFYRTRMRGQFLLEERPLSDCCTHCLCEQCALCQEYRELQHQGFDMSFVDELRCHSFRYRGVILLIK
ncbi:hypothetical protein Csa_008429 [Cucumis sativus]|nr:hypothetical protein Csa_008429 [Cucumis sativus]